MNLLKKSFLLQFIIKDIQINSLNSFNFIKLSCDPSGT